MKKIKEFFYGYGSILDLFPNFNSINNDWKMVGDYMQTAIKKFPEMSNETREKFRKNRRYNKRK